MRLIVPWRPDGGRREELWDHCRPIWDGWPLILAPSPEGPFNRAAAINAGAEGSWDVAVVADADVVIDPEHVRAAVEAATDRLVFPFTEYVGLTETGTSQFLAGAEVKRFGTVSRRTKIHESSVVVIPRSVWDTVGPFDSRFSGWGQEDVAYVQACRVLTGEPQRVTGTVTHLWHPPAPERARDNPRWAPNHSLGRRYRFTRDPEAMRALLDEGAELAG